MGVLARLFRRSKATEAKTSESQATEEAATQEAATDTATEEAPEAVGAQAPPSPEASAGSREDGGEAERAKQTAAATEPGGARQTGHSETVTEAAAGAAAVSGPDGVEIPRQQSAEEVADSEAGEGART
ncbi:hypothetical protein ACIBVL_29805 [Streptomyces sp. NPDC049687]|uniref:hypothetical protein n=1 Tax=Streptomyces sp. NPDC049687 TaxID=3365596 RepID=UPI00379E4A4E